MSPRAQAYTLMCVCIQSHRINKLDPTQGTQSGNLLLRMGACTFFYFRISRIRSSLDHTREHPFLHSIHLARPDLHKHAKIFFSFPSLLQMIVVVVFCFKLRPPLHLPHYLISQLIEFGPEKCRESNQNLIRSKVKRNGYKRQQHYCHVSRFYIILIYVSYQDQRKTVVLLANYACMHMQLHNINGFSIEFWPGCCQSQFEV